MFQVILDIFSDALIDSLKLVPFLFFAFLIIELLEHKFSKYTNSIMEKSGRFGPIIGSILGVFPQCGFSVMATNLYVTKIVSLGTLISIYLSTSDEMLPILLSHEAPFSLIGKILGIKVIIAIICGFIIDLVFKSDLKGSTHNDICHHEHCHCEESIIKSSLKHTFNIFIFVFIFLLILSSAMEYIGEDVFYNIFNKNSIFSPLITSLIGLIPSCGASVIITELYLNNIIPFSSLISGLLTGSGVALVVLFKTNNNLKSNLKILALLYGIGAISGLIIELIEILF